MIWLVEGSKRSLTANLVVVSTGKPRSGEPTVAVLVINGPFSFCIAHLFLSSAGTEVPIDRVQDSSIVHDDVVGYFLEAAVSSERTGIVVAFLRDTTLAMTISRCSMVLKMIISAWKELMS